MNAVRILIADDHELVRQGLISILKEAHPEWQIVGEARGGAEALEMAAELKPDIAILDLSMPEPNGLRVTEQLALQLPSVRIVVLSIHTAEPVTRQLKRAGASAFLAKNEAASRLVAAVERVLEGIPFFASESAARHPNQLGSRERVPVQYLLTTRELDVLRRLALGKGNKEIAHEMDISVRTVETHRAEIMLRLGVESLGDLVRIALEDGLAA